MADLTSCDTATSTDCVGPARERGDDIRLLTCYRCGANTCTACSSLQPASILVGDRLRVRDVRMCDNCLEREPDGQARVLLRRYHEAGHTNVTIERARLYVATYAAYAPRTA